MLFPWSFGPRETQTVVCTGKLEATTVTILTLSPSTHESAKSARTYPNQPMRLGTGSMRRQACALTIHILAQKSECFWLPSSDNIHSFRQVIWEPGLVGPSDPGERLALQGHRHSRPRRPCGVFWIHPPATRLLVAFALICSKTCGDDVYDLFFFVFISLSIFVTGPRNALSS